MGYSETMYATQEFYPQIFMLSVSTFVVIFVYQIFAVIFWNGKRVWNILLHTLGVISEFSLLIATIVYYGKSLQAYNEIDITMLNFIVSKKCSEGPLQYAIEKATEKFELQLQITQLGMAFTIICLIFTIFIAICFSDIRVLIIDIFFKEKFEDAYGPKSIKATQQQSFSKNLKLSSVSKQRYGQKLA